MKNRMLILAVFAVLVLVASLAWAQLPVGSIVGTVTDPAGAVVPGAKLVLRDTETGATRAATTTSVGYFEFPELRPSTYELRTEVPGFKTVLSHNIVVHVGVVVHLDLKLELGAVTQTLEVTSEIPLIEPDKTSISHAIDNRAIKTLPLFERQFLNLALTTPGTVPQAPGTQAGGFNVAGMRSQSNNFTLDGISNNDPQVNGPLQLFRIADAVQEFSVQTSIASTEVGRNSGAQVSIITKSGGNTYHGSAFYYGRNDFFDANDFFLNKAGQPRNPLKRHQYGGTLGGFIKRDKLFWFFSYERFQQAFQNPITARVPTAAERAAVTDLVSQRVLQFYPPANTPLAGNINFTGTTTDSNKNHTYLWRVDYNLTAKHRLMTRYAWFRGATDTLQSTARPFHGNITNKPGQHNFVLAETWSTGKVVNDVRVGFSRNRTFFQPTDVSLNPATIFTDAAGNPLPGFVDTRVDQLDGGLPNITVAGFAGLGAGNNMPQGRATNTYEVMDDLVLTSPAGASRHTLKVGAYYRHEITNRFLNGFYRGQISFACFVPSAACSRSFATGNPQRGSLRTGAGGTFRTWIRDVWSWYAQDTWKPIPNLTINLGIRWEEFGQLRERFDRGSNFVPGIGMMVLDSNLRIDISPTALGRAALILTPVTFHLNRSGARRSDLNNFAPWLGIAYTPKWAPWLFGDGKTVVRTGFRLGYDDIFANIPVNMGLNPPQVLSTTLLTGTYTWPTVLNQNTPLFGRDPTVAGGRRGIVTFNAWDINPHTAYAMNYALEIERELFRDYAFEISYVGTQGRKLGVFTDPNQPTVIVNDPTRVGSEFTGTPNRRIFPFNQYSNIFLGSFVSNSSYNGMVVALKKRPSHGFSYTVWYTLAKALDDNSAFFGSDADNGSYADTRNRKLDHGRSGFDIRHRIVATADWQLPFGPGRRWFSRTHGVLGHVIGGWDVSSITTWRGGFPFTIFAGTSFDYSGFNQFADRPNWAPGVTGLPINYSNPDNVYPCKTGAGNCTPFVAPTAGQAGTVGRNIFRGPKYTDVDFALLKNFPFGEGKRVQFRAEFYNLFNHKNFALPNLNAQFRFPTSGANAGRPVFPTNATSSTIGTVTATSTEIPGTAARPRVMQLGLRIDF